MKSSSPSEPNEQKRRVSCRSPCRNPVLLGFIPVGIAYAIMARQAGFDIFETCFMSVAVFAGASQMMAVGMYAQGAVFVLYLVI
ncbi:MAG: AzlC family ABC transporter permease [Methanocorpusculum sp.]|nr:AzlC family ABC transporter permease [Methanocorpusculum sp.]